MTHTLTSSTSWRAVYFIRLAQLSDIRKIGGLYKGSNINLEDAVSNKTHVLLTGPRNRRNISAIWQNSINQKSCCFLHQLNWPPLYNWNIVESGVKHHKPNQIVYIFFPSEYKSINHDFIRQTRPKSLTNFITNCCIEYTSPWTGLELTTLVKKQM
jgi:hypothetical protein